MSIDRHSDHRSAGFLRRARSVFAPKLQGQDVERPDTVPGRRTGSHFAAMLSSHSSQSMSPMGFGR